MASNEQQAEQGFANPHLQHEKTVERVAEAGKHASQPFALGLLALQTLLAIGFMIYYAAGYEAWDFDPLKDAINNGDYLALPGIMADAPKDPVTHGMKVNQLVFLAIVTALSAGFGFASILRLNRPGISVTIVCQVAVWSTIHMQMSNDEGLIVFAGIVDLVCIATCAMLYRLSDSIQEYHIGSEYAAPTKAVVDRFRMIVSAAGALAVLVGAVFIILTAMSDVKDVVRNTTLAIWVGHTLGGLTILCGLLSLLGTLTLTTSPAARPLLVSSFGTSLCTLSFGCFFIVWYAYRSEGLALFCGLNDAMLASANWDADKCSEQEALQATTLAFLFVLCVVCGALAWASLQLSEKVQSYGIAGGAEYQWKIGGPGPLSIRRLRSFINVELFVMWSLCCMLLAFTIALRKDNETMDGRLDAYLRASAMVVGGSAAVALCRLAKAEMHLAEARRVLVFAFIFQLWVAGNAFHAFPIEALIHKEGFSAEPYLRAFMSSTAYSGTRVDILGLMGLFTGLMSAWQVIAVTINLLELESDYNLEGFLWEDAKKDDRPAVSEATL